MYFSPIYEDIYNSDNRQVKSVEPILFAFPVKFNFSETETISVSDSLSFEINCIVDPYCTSSFQLFDFYPVVDGKLHKACASSG